MGIPQHYSRDLAQRCDALLDELLPVVEAGLETDGRFGGPLKTTLLLALATPMVILPVERIFKRLSLNDAGVADDRHIDENLSAGVNEMLGTAQLFRQAPVGLGHWSYVPIAQPFNVGDQWSTELLDHFDTDEAKLAAKTAPTWRILQDLRNALAHGGVAYLDQYGRASSGGAEMLAFAGAVIKRNKLVSLNLLRIQKDDFRTFLSAWARWLTEAGVAQALSDVPPLAD